MIRLSERQRVRETSLGNEQLLADRETVANTGNYLWSGNLYQGEKLAFEFRRTESRLTEMQSTEYLHEAHIA